MCVGKIVTYVSHSLVFRYFFSASRSVLVAGKYICVKRKREEGGGEEEELIDITRKEREELQVYNNMFSR